LPDGKNLIARWAAEMFILGGRVRGQDTKWMKDTCRQIYTMARSPAIKVCLTIEMELVTNYFDITHGHHAYTGEFKRRAGFITMELHYLYFDFIVPFWLTAQRDPKVCFLKTYTEIIALDDEDLKKMKLEQLQAKVQASFDKVSKNSELLLEAPLIFMLLTHPLEGPSVLRAIIAILVEQKFDVNDPDVIWIDKYCEVWSKENFDSKKYKSDEALETMNEKDRAYFLQLRPTADDVVHFFRQFGFHRAVMRKELLSLVKETTPVRDANSKTPLQDFQKSYPTIYETLESAFKWSASNSRIVELLHAENTFDVDLTDKTEDEILQVFARADKSVKLKETQEQVADKWQKIENIYHLSASKISPKFQKLMYQLPVELEDGSDDEEE
jgi:hypothetical protein